MTPIDAPSASAAIAPMITEAMTAPVPSVKNQGNRGKMAPTENDRNDVTAARQAEPGACGVDTQFQTGMGVKGDIGIGGQDAGNGIGVFSRQALSPVHASQLPPFPLGILGELRALDLYFPLDHLLLCPDRYQLACRHRECSRQQPR